MTKYEGPIVDAHHHFWEPSLGRQPWLLPNENIPFRYVNPGDNYDQIKQDYLPPDLLEDAKDFKIVGTVTMETEWDEDDQAGEMVYMQEMQDRFGLPNACVAHAILDDPGLDELLERYSQIPIVRSVRHKPGQSSTPSEARSFPSKMVDENWRKGYETVWKSGLHFDLQVAWWHLHEAVELAREFPEQTVIINHSALPSNRAPEMMAGWKAAIRSVAECPNVLMKISGIGLPNVPWTAENNRPVVEGLVEAFGADRCMFASNFPVDSLCGSYRDIFGGFLEISKDWSAAEQTDTFIGTAVRAYGLNPLLLTAEHAPLQAYSNAMRAEFAG